MLGSGITVSFCISFLLLSLDEIRNNLTAPRLDLGPKYQRPLSRPATEWHRRSLMMLTFPISGTSYSFYPTQWTQTSHMRSVSTMKPTSQPRSNLTKEDFGSDPEILRNLPFSWEPSSCFPLPTSFHTTLVQESSESLTGCSRPASHSRSLWGAFPLHQKAQV